MLVRYVGRPERASPAEGYDAWHKTEQARIVGEVLAPPPKGRGEGAGAPGPKAGARR
jgi:hypothetical protein